VSERRKGKKRNLVVVWGRVKVNKWRGGTGGGTEKSLRELMRGSGGVRAVRL